MKISSHCFGLILILLVLAVSQMDGQGIPKEPRTIFTFEQIQQMCGLSIDRAKDGFSFRRTSRDSSYQDSIVMSWREKHQRPLQVESIPNWRSMMGEVENQNTESCTMTCWIHAATGVVEGQLHILLDSNINIDLSEADILSGISANCTGGLVDDALDYIQTSRAASESGSFPNLNGIKWGIVEYHYLSGIDAIKAALESGPVTAGFTVYEDFVTFFNQPANSLQTYHHTSGQQGIGHAVVIASYDDDGHFWLCKNSWGSGWADDGYFRIGYGQCGIDDSPENCNV
jgi:C1A family cysteine protease